MKYAGGKFHIAKRIAAYINEVRNPGQPYWEPFVGAANVAQYIGEGPNYFSDAHKDLIDLLKAVRGGWKPPSYVSLKQYKDAKAADPSPYRTFVGYASSFGGKWWGGYARVKAGDYNGQRNYAAEDAVSLVRKVNRIKNPYFFQADFLEAEIPVTWLGKLIIYCDPPYQGTLGYSYLEPFDHGRFWDRLRTLGDDGHTILVSEYQAPDDFSEVASWTVKRKLRTPSSRTHTEKLFRYGDHYKMQRKLL